MAYQHGLYVTEIPTEIVPFRRIDSNVIVAIGIAPTYCASDPVAPNTPSVCYNFEQFAARFGYIDVAHFGEFGLTEVANCVFNIYNVSPVVFINVLDPNKHYTARSMTVSAFVREDGRDTFTIEDSLWTETIVLKNSDNDTLKSGVDYEVERLDRSHVKVTMLNASAYDGAISVSYHAVNVSAVTSQDIIGAVDATTGRSTGLELLKEIYPRFKMTVGIVIAPGFSHLSDVAASMAVKSANISHMFRAVAICDIPTVSTSSPAGVRHVAQWKDNHSFNASNMICCYPCVSLNGAIYHMSTHVAAVCCQSDYENDGIPIRSPSNQLVSIDGMVNSDGTENYFGMDEVVDLNGNGVISVIQMDGFRLFGNRTAAYPGNRDVKDSFISVRRMFSWVSNNIVLNFFPKIDVPITRPNIDSIINSMNTWLNGLTSRGALQGGRIVFDDQNNPKTDLMDGILHFKVYITPPSPARAIFFELQYDADYLSTLFT